MQLHGTIIVISAFLYSHSWVCQYKVCTKLMDKFFISSGEKQNKKKTRTRVLHSWIRNECATVSHVPCRWQPCASEFTACATSVYHHRALAVLLVFRAASSQCQWKQSDVSLNEHKWYALTVKLSNRVWNWNYFFLLCERVPTKQTF